MALHLHRADRTDLLADGLGRLLSTPLPDPFAEELVIVPAKGVIYAGAWQCAKAAGFHADISKHAASLAIPAGVT